MQTGSKQLTNRNCDIVFDQVGFAYQGAVPDREPELDAGEDINPLAKWGKRSHSVDVSSCPIVIFQCRDNRNDSDPSPFVHFVYHTTILEIKRRNPNPSPIGMMFGFLGFGGA